MSPKCPSVRSSQQSAHCASSQCPAIVWQTKFWRAKNMDETFFGVQKFGVQTWLFFQHTMLWAWIFWYPIFGHSMNFSLQRRCEQWSVFFRKKPTMCTMCQWYSGSKSWRRLKVAGNWPTGITTSKWPNFWTPYGLPYRPCRFPNSWLLHVATYLLHLVTCLSWWPWLDAEKMVILPMPRLSGASIVPYWDIGAKVCAGDRGSDPHMAKTDLQNVADDLYLVVKKGNSAMNFGVGSIYLSVYPSICRFCSREWRS
jgi:hypothetical protein